MFDEIDWGLVVCLLIVLALLRRRLHLALCVVLAAVVWDALAGSPRPDAAVLPTLADGLGSPGLFALAMIGLLPGHIPLHRPPRA